MIRQFPNLPYSIWTVIFLSLLITGIIDKIYTYDVHFPLTLVMIPFALLMGLSGFVFMGLSKWGQKASTPVQVFILFLWVLVLFYPLLLSILHLVTNTSSLSTRSFSWLVNSGFFLWLLAQMLAFVLLVVLYFSEDVKG